MTSTVDFKKVVEAAHDDENFCVICLRSRKDVPVEANCCYECGGGSIPKEKLH